MSVKHREHSLILLLLLSVVGFFAHADQQVLFDEQRQRPIPISLTYPQAHHCTQASPCKLAVLSSGYGVPHTAYQFIADELLKNKYAVITVQHQLKDDPGLSIVQPFTKTRAENWQRGAENLNFVLSRLADKYQNINFDKITLVGHSNGGDIGAWFVKAHSQQVETLITLDHRRVPLPRLNSINVLSIRGSDYPADVGVLYTLDELKRLNACVVTIKKSRHNDMTDDGPTWLKTEIQSQINRFINQAQCG